MRLFSFFILLSLLVSQAYANDNTPNVSGSNHFYVSAQAGLGSMQTPKMDDATNYNLSNFTWRYAVGYLYAIQKMEYGVEIGHNGYLDNTYGENPVITRFKGNSNDLLLVVRYDFYQAWHLFTEFGAADFHLKTLSSATEPSSQNKNKILPELAFGFGYNFTKRLSLNLSFDYEFGKKPTLNPQTYEVIDNRVPTTSSILAGFTYTF